ncbi:hypothetical protein Hamer_G024920 [Homarus americanus]|uniref:Uncharacterized protein n=1 Tax=Homarus americanus TaxID=6706 RepID=A0A8J5J7N8_HOMAM|nr:hypothetical protein Hamer_G024920 [Homarus americanus]
MNSMAPSVRLPVMPTWAEDTDKRRHIRFNAPTSMETSSLHLHRLTPTQQLSTRLMLHPHNLGDVIVLCMITRQLTQTR